MPLKNVTCVTAELGLNTERIRSPTAFTSMLSSTSGLWVLKNEVFMGACSPPPKHTHTHLTVWNQVQVFVWCTRSKSWLDYRLGCVQHHPKSTSSTKHFTALSIYIIMPYQKPAVTPCNESKCFKQIAKICWNYKWLEPQSSLLKTKVKTFGLDLSQKSAVLPQIKVIWLFIDPLIISSTSLQQPVQTLMLKFSRYRSFCF